MVRLKVDWISGPKPPSWVVHVDGENICMTRGRLTSGDFNPRRGCIQA